MTKYRIFSNTAFSSRIIRTMRFVQTPCSDCGLAGSAFSHVNRKVARVAPMIRTSWGSANTLRRSDAAIAVTTNGFHFFMHRIWREYFSAFPIHACERGRGNLVVAPPPLARSCRLHRPCRLGCECQVPAMPPDIRLAMTGCVTYCLQCRSNT